MVHRDGRGGRDRGHLDARPHHRRGATLAGSVAVTRCSWSPSTSSHPVPPMAGYSGTPLVKKLGLKADHCVVLLEAPPDFAATLQGLPERVALHSDLPRSSRLDIILFFATSQAHLRQRFRALAQRLAPAGGLWIAWLKKASGVPTDLSED